MRDLEKMLFLKRVPLDTDSPGFIPSIFIVCRLQNLLRLPIYDLRQPSFNELLSRMIKRLFGDIQGRRLIWGLECTWHISEQDIPEKKAEDGAKNAALTVESGI